MPRLIAALPAYNEEACLAPLLERFNALFDSLPEMWEDPIVIVVDDGSKDGTAAVAEDFATRMPVRLGKHEQNKGLGEAIKTGLRAALEESTSDADIIICMDADNTHPPENVPPMLDKIAAGADIVIASRYQKGSEQHGVPFNRRMMSYGALVLFKMFLNLPNTWDYTCGFRAYRSSLVKRAFDEYGDQLITRNGFACTDQLLVNLACLGDVDIQEVPFILRYDLKEGESKLNLGVTIGETFGLLFAGRKRLKAAKKRRRDSHK